MFRTALIALAFTGFSSLAAAHPEPEAPDTVKPAKKITTPQLPTQGEIEDILENMPDFNAIMGDMMGVMQDEKLQTKLKSTAKTFGGWTHAMPMACRTLMRFLGQCYP